MILRSKNEYNSHEDEASDEDKEKSGGAYPREGELLMIRRTLNNQPIMKHESQRENIFRTKCKILKNTCSLIVDNGS